MNTTTVNAHANRCIAEGGETSIKNMTGNASQTSLLKAHPTENDMPQKSNIENSSPLGYRLTMSNAAHEFRITINFDIEVKKWYVENTEMPGLYLEDAHPGQLLDRLTVAANDLLKAGDGDYAKNLCIAQGDTVRLIPVYQAVDVAA